jgi:hypothetical protein
MVGDWDSAELSRSAASIGWRLGVVARAESQSVDTL